MAQSSLNRVLVPGPQSVHLHTWILTNCGHVYCDVCLDKGRKGECLICKVPCRTLLLSEH
ncbi:rnf212 protein, partial [Lynx pardinus]